MSEPFRDALPDERVFVVCPTCAQAVETEPASPVARCANCNQSFAVRDAQTLVEHDAAARLAKALAPIPEETPYSRRWRKLGFIGGVAAPAILAGSGLLFGATGLLLASLGVGVLIAAAMGRTKADPYSGGPD